MITAEESQRRGVWTTLSKEQRTHLIQSIWRDGISAAEIGQAVGCSKNAVIGHYSRHGQSLSDYPLPMSMVERNRTGNIKESTRNRRQYADNHTKPKNTRLPPIKPSQPDLPKHAIPSTAGIGLYVSMMDNTGCTWPLNDGGPYLFCGHVKFGKYSYCEHHHERSRGRGTISERAAHRVSELHASS